jgi:GNAT superfamily N-acetyltransferase
MLERIEAHWAERLGCGQALLRRSGVHVLPRSDDSHLYVVQTGDVAIALAPDALCAELSAVALPEALVDQQALEPLLPGATRYVGPAFVGYTDRVESLPLATDSIASARDARFDVLRRATPPEQWQHAGLDAAAGPIFTVSSAGVVVAASGFEIIAGEVAHIGVLCDPDSRRRGLGRAVVASAAREAIARGLLAQYQTLWANHAAIRIARALGFAHFATTMAAHLNG